ncbi:MAG: hypothetical protein COW34_12855, partial [Armatimonadetes bacterium CG17_big_fil_post_rev_8_21_14_2_50_66_6]
MRDGCHGAALSPRALWDRLCGGYAGTSPGDCLQRRRRAGGCRGGGDGLPRAAARSGPLGRSPDRIAH